MASKSRAKLRECATVPRPATTMALASSRHSCGVIRSARPCDCAASACSSRDRGPGPEPLGPLGGCSCACTRTPTACSTSLTERLRRRFDRGTAVSERPHRMLLPLADDAVDEGVRAGLHARRLPARRCPGVQGLPQQPRVAHAVRHHPRRVRRLLHEAAQRPGVAGQVSRQHRLAHRVHRHHVAVLEDVHRRRRVRGSGQHVR